MESAIIFEADLVYLVDKIILMTAPERNSYPASYG